MEAEEKITVLHDVFDVDWNQTDSPVAEDLKRFTHGVPTDHKYTWYDDDVFINILMDEFPDDHPLWGFIILD